MALLRRQPTLGLSRHTSLFGTNLVAGELLFDPKARGLFQIQSRVKELS